MQFSEAAPLNLYLDLPPAPGPTTTKLPRPWTVPPLPPYSSSSSSSSSSSRSLTTFSSASCMEQLLVHCANAVDHGDATLAHQILWVLNTIAPPDGDSTQRLTSAFLRSLITRASRSSSSSSLSTTTSPLLSLSPSPVYLHSFSPLQLASFLDLTPFHRFGFTSSNFAISNLDPSFPVLHVVDLSTTHCMQIPTLIDSLASRPEGPPFLRLTVPLPSSSSPPPHRPPLLDPSYVLEDLASRLVSFARSRNVAMEFRAIPSDPSDAFQTLIDHIRIHRLISSSSSESEALVINCHMLLHHIPDDSIHPSGSSSSTSADGQLSLRTTFLKNLRSLEPNLVTLVDEDVDLTAVDVVGRLRSAFNYMWIPYDAVDTFLPKGSERREWYEGGLCWKIENVVACEGIGRVERSETRGKWAQRMRSAGFRGVGFSEEAAGEVKGMLDEHAVGWGLKREDTDLVLTWKGHNVVFATAWVPS